MKTNKLTNIKCPMLGVLVLCVWHNSTNVYSLPLRHINNIQT